MGKFSRSKGRREEQQLVLALANLGFKAERILRQYQAAGQPDVRAYGHGRPEVTFEMKSRQQSFKTIYALYRSERDHLGRLLFSLDGKLVAMSTDLMTLFNFQAEQTPYFIGILPDSRFLKTYKRIVKLYDLKQNADYLVIRDNGEQRLFIKYW